MLPIRIQPGGGHHWPEALEHRCMLSGHTVGSAPNVNIEVPGQGTLTFAQSTTASAPAAFVAVNGQLYQQTFDAEFNGTTLDTSQWNTDLNGQLSEPFNGDQGDASASQDIVSGGQLLLGVANAPAGTLNEFGQPVRYLQGAVNSANFVLPPNSVFQWQGILNWDHVAGWATSLTDANHAGYFGEIDNGEEKGRNNLSNDVHLDPGFPPSPAPATGIISSPANHITYLAGVKIDPTQLNTYTAVYNADGTVSFYVTPTYGPGAGQTFAAGTSDGLAFNPNDPRSTLALFFTIETDQNYGTFEADANGITTTASAMKADGDTTPQPRDYAMSVNWTRVYSVPKAPTATVALPATADAYVQDGASSNVNYGSATPLLVKDAAAGGGWLRKAYLQFNLAGVTPITHASLNLYGSEQSGTAGSFINVGVYPVSSSNWTEGTITNANAPAIGSTALATAAITGTSPRLYSFDVSSYLQQQQAAGAASVTLAVEGTSFTNVAVAFNSREAASNQPRLTLTTFTPTTTAAIVPVSPSPTNMPVSQVTITFSAPVTGVTLAAVSLTNNGGANLLTSAQTLTTTDNQTFVLGNLTGLTSSDGAYTLSVSTTAGIRDLAGLPLASGASASFIENTTPPAVTITPVVPNPSSVPVPQIAFTFSKPVSGVSLAALSLTNNGSANLLTSAQTLTTTDNQTFVLGNLSGLTSVQGAYTLVVSPGGIQDLAGNPLQNGALASFVVSATTPMVAITPVVPNPTNVPVPQITFAFNEPVTGVTLDALSLSNAGGANLLTAAQTLTTTDNQTFVLGNLSGLTSGNGAYTFAVSAAGISDQSGSLLQNGDSASFVVNTTPPSVAITPVVPSPSSVPISQITVTFSEPVTGVSLAALSLTNNGGANLLSSAQTLTTTDDQTYVLGNLTGLTSGNGAYTLVVSATTGIRDFAGNSLQNGAIASFAVNTTMPTATITPVLPNPSSTAVGQIGIVFNEPVSGFTLSSLTLTQNGGANLLTAAQTLTSTDQTHWIVGNLAPLTTAGGTYALTLNPSTAITDSIGNSLAVAATTSFTVVTPTPTPTTLSLPAAADSYVQDGSYTSTNYGSAASLLVKGAVAGHGYVRTAYLKFNLTGIAPITSATLRLFGSEQPGAPESAIAVGVYASANSNWTESTITNSKAPVIGSSPLATANIAGTTPKLYSFNLSTYLKQQQAAGAAYVTLAIRGMSFTNGMVGFNSREAATNTPQLVVSGLLPG